jgi:hypothetical protein
VSTVTDITGLVALESQAPAEVTAPVVEAPATEEKTTEVGTKTDPKVEPEAKPDAKAEEKKPDAKVEEATGQPKTLPDQKAIHETLKAFYAEATPEGKEKLQKLNSEIRDLYAAHKESLSASKDVSEVVTNAKELQELVQASDELVYAGDPQIVSNIYEDVVAQNGNAEAFDKLVPAFVDKLKETNPKAYYEQHVAPIYQHALESTGMVDAVRGLIKAYNTGDQVSLRAGIESIAKHLQEVGSKVEQHKVDAEKATLAKEQNAARATLERDMSLDVKQSLGAALGPVLKSTELGQYPRETLVELSRYILKEAERRIDTDAAFNKTLEKLYKEKGAEAVKAENLKKIQSIAKSVVDDVVKQVYPNLGKRSASAEAPTATYIDTAEGTALVVKSKPAKLDRTVKRADVLEIAGRGYTTINGKRTLVSWRKN